MKLEIFTIYDHAAKAYNKPFFVQTVGIAIRTFQATVNEEQNGAINQNPEQFTLFKIGVYDDSDGSIISLDTPEPVMKALDVLEPSNTINKDQISETLMTLLDKVNNLEKIIGQVD